MASDRQRVSHHRNGGVVLGWIAIDRCLLDSAIWNTGEPFTKGQAWVDLLLLANYEDTEQYVGYELVKVPRGTYMTTIRDLSTRWNWSRSKVANFLHFLEMQKMVNIKSDTKKTLVTVIKYRDFQDIKDTKKTPKRHASDTRKTREGNLLYKETREQGNNIIEETTKTFRKPSVDDVREYCASRGNNIDPEAFVDYYESKGWMIGKNKMKDWRAAVRTWEKNEKERGTSQSGSRAKTIDDVLREEYQRSLEMEGINET